MIIIIDLMALFSALLVVFLIGLFLLLAGIATAIAYYFHTSYNYWTRKGVPTIEPQFPWGNANTICPKGPSIGILSKAFYDKFKKRGLKFGGVYMVTRPALVIVDPDYINDVLEKQHFHRGFFHLLDKKQMCSHLFTVDSSEWKNFRVTHTRIFTSDKMEMFWTVNESCSYMKEDMEAHLGEDLDIKDYVSRFTIDFIGSYGFGMDRNSFKDPDDRFHLMVKKMFEIDLLQSESTFLAMCFPKIFKYITKIDVTNPCDTEFFEKLVEEIVKMRKEKKIWRYDFLQILIDMKKEMGFSLHEMMAQIFHFFVAGFDTTSTVVTFVLYELAKNHDIQEKLRKEMYAVLSNFNDKITYESLSQMKYLNQVFEESLRMYPPMPTVTRCCTFDYCLPGTNLIIEKGTPIVISVLGLHMNEEYYPKPEIFDPDRFSEENKKGRRSCVYLPFGDGPRNCVGQRLGQVLSKIVIATIIKNFKLTVSPDMKPVKFDPYMFLLNSVDKVFLRAEKVTATV